MENTTLSPSCNEDGKGGPVAFCLWQVVPVPTFLVWIQDK